jgi:hypothetical protein
MHVAAIGLTVVVLARDAATTLDACLTSLRPFSDVLVVVDTRSVDGTEEIARRHGATVVHLPWQGGFAAQRNAAATLARHDWVLFVDADEEVTPALATEVLQTIEHGPNKPAYSVPRRNNLLGRWMKAGGWWPDRQVRLINRLEVHYIGAVHERVELVPDQIGALSAPLLHRTHTSLEALLARVDAYSALEAQTTQEVGEPKPSWLTITLAPVLHLIWRYLVLLGFLDGWQGLAEARMQAYYRHLTMLRRRSGATAQAASWARHLIPSGHAIATTAAAPTPIATHWFALLPDPLAIGFGLLLVLLPFHLVLKRLLPGPLGVGWKELLLIALALFALTRLRLAGIRTLRYSWLLLAAGFYLAFVILRTALGSHTPAALEGLRIDETYAAAALIVLTLPEAVRLSVLVWTTLAIGIISAIGAIIEVLLSRSLVPSQSLLQQYGRAEVYIEGMHVLRPYFVFDFPTGLGTYLAVAVVFAAALYIAGRKGWALLIGLLCAMALTLTFSRGPWIAALAGLAVVGMLAAKSRMVPRFALVAGMAFLLIASALITGKIGAAKAHAIRLVSSPQLRTVVGPPRGGHVFLSLLQNGNLVKRLNLPPPGRPSQIFWRIDGQRALVLSEPPPPRGQAVLQYRVHVPSDSVLAWGIALDPRVWMPERGDGVTFRIAINDHGEHDVAFAHYLDPKNLSADRHAFHYRLPLYGYAGDTILLTFSTDAGPRGDADFDWAAWLNPRLLTLPRWVDLNRWPYQSVPMVQIERPVVYDGNYVATIADWRDDQSNSDRIAAWHRTIQAWLRSPLFGLGPGSSDEAALRSHVAKPLITESQLGKVLVETGLAGLLLWIALCATALWRGFAVYRREQRAEYLALLGGVTCILVASLAFQVLEVKQIDLLFWAILGVVAGGELATFSQRSITPDEVLVSSTAVADVPMQPASGVVLPLSHELSPMSMATNSTPQPEETSAPSERATAVPEPVIAPAMPAVVPPLVPVTPLSNVAEVVVVQEDTAVNARLQEGWELLATGVTVAGALFVLGRRVVDGSS